MIRSGAVPLSPQYPYPGENAYYPPASTDPVRPFNPYTGVTINQQTSQPHSVGLWGVLLLVGVVLAFEHFRRGR